MTEKVIEIEEKYKQHCLENMEESVDKHTFMLHHVLNEKNKWVTSKFINNIFKTHNLKHKVSNLEIYKESFIHDAYLETNLLNFKHLRQIKDTQPIDNITKKIIPLQQKSYQRLEYLGDAVIHIAIAKYLYERYPNEDEGFLTKIRTRLENGKQNHKLQEHWDYTNT